MIYTSGYNTSTPYVALNTQYIDLPTGLRGQSTLLGTTLSGKQELLYLPEKAMQTGSNNTFDSTLYNWAPSLLG